eukprot:gb/GECG01013045.1/.p1 GENE.gb/GECG01013045.1/~~gb/GECG01013045.1/.p1  ORF type:complete len:821 (+),score=150.56 gb/GECG01013045.1/:1-2463(+)
MSGRLSSAAAALAGSGSANRAYKQQQQSSRRQQHAYDYEFDVGVEEPPKSKVYGELWTTHRKKQPQSGKHGSSDPYDFEIVDDEDDDDAEEEQQGRQGRRHSQKKHHSPSNQRKKHSSNGSPPTQRRQQTEEFARRRTEDNPVSKAQYYLNKYGLKQATQAKRTTQTSDALEMSESFDTGTSSFEEEESPQQKPGTVSENRDRPPSGLNTEPTVVLNEHPMPSSVKPAAREDPAGGTRYGISSEELSMSESASDSFVQRNNIKFLDPRGNNAFSLSKGPSATVSSATQAANTKDDTAFSVESSDTNDDSDTNNEVQQNVPYKKIQTISKMQQPGDVAEEVESNDFGADESNSLPMSKQAGRNTSNEYDDAYSESFVSESELDSPVAKETASSKEKNLPPGTRVNALFGARAGGTEYFTGKVADVNDDGTYRIVYDDGDDEDGVLREDIRVMDSGAPRLESIEEHPVNKPPGSDGRNTADSYSEDYESPTVGASRHSEKTSSSQALQVDSPLREHVAPEPSVTAPTQKHTSASVSCGPAAATSQRSPAGQESLHDRNVSAPATGSEHFRRQGGSHGSYTSHSGYAAVQPNGVHPANAPIPPPEYAQAPQGSYGFTFQPGYPTAPMPPAAQQYMPQMASYVFPGASYPFVPPGVYPQVPQYPYQHQDMGPRRFPQENGYQSRIYRHLAENLYKEEGTNDATGHRKEGNGDDSTEGQTQSKSRQPPPFMQQHVNSYENAIALTNQMFSQQLSMLRSNIKQLREKRNRSHDLYQRLYNFDDGWRTSQASDKVDAATSPTPVDAAVGCSRSAGKQSAFQSVSQRQ